LFLVSTKIPLLTELEKFHPSFIHVQSVVKKTIAPNASNPPALRFGATSARRPCQNPSRRLIAA
jgi:hypothetical protein